MDTVKNMTLIQWIGLIIGLNSLFMGATPQLTVLFGTAAVPYIVAIATLGNGALGVFSMVVGGQASQIRNVAAMPGVARVQIDTSANQTVAQVAIDPTQPKVGATRPEVQATLNTIAKGA